MSGEQVHLVVAMPTKHPMTGRYGPVIQSYSDRIITDDQADELRMLYDLPAAPGSLSFRVDELPTD